MNEWVVLTPAQHTNRPVKEITSFVADFLTMVCMHIMFETECLAFSSEVRLVLLALTELFPDVAFTFVLSSLFTTAVAIILLSRKPGTHHDDILAKISVRCVEVQLNGADKCENFSIKPAEESN